VWWWEHWIRRLPPNQQITLQTTSPRTQRESSREGQGCRCRAHGCRVAARLLPCERPACLSMPLAFISPQALQVEVRHERLGLVVQLRRLQASGC
jgi:hypothetical protein